MTEKYVLEIFLSKVDNIEAESVPVQELMQEREKMLLPI